MKIRDTKKPHLHPFCINFGSGIVLCPLCLCHAAVPLARHQQSERRGRDAAGETCVDSCLTARKPQTLEVNVIPERWEFQLTTLWMLLNLGLVPLSSTLVVLYCEAACFFSLCPSTFLSVFKRAAH